jgi:hypothetical protein
MDVNSTAANGVSEPLYENQYVKELYSILQESGRDTSGLSALLGHVSEMESFVKNAEDKISVMKDQLAEMKEIQNHPVKTALTRAIKNLEHTVTVMKSQISKLKENIVEGCKSAVTAFKEKGATALNNLASFFKVKSAVNALDKAANDGVKTCDDAVSKIIEFSKTYHQAGLAFRNMGRILSGKPTQTAAKEAGKLSKALAAPYKAKQALLVKISSAAKSTVLKLDNLDARQAVKQAERAREKKPSLLENLAAKKELVAAKKLEMPTPERVKTANLEV